jgi:hypothetical protein
MDALYPAGNAPSLNDNDVNRVISEANTSTHGLMINVEILSMGYNSAGIEQINFLTPSTDAMAAGCRLVCR